MNFTKEEVAARFRKSIRTIERWTQPGKDGTPPLLKKIKPNPARGGHVLFTEQEVERVERQLGIATA